MLLLVDADFLPSPTLVPQYRKQKVSRSTSSHFVSNCRNPAPGFSLAVITFAAESAFAAYSARAFLCSELLLNVLASLNSNHYPCFFKMSLGCLQGYAALLERLNRPAAIVLPAFEASPAIEDKRSLAKEAAQRELGLPRRQGVQR